MIPHFEPDGKQAVYYRMSQKKRALKNTDKFGAM